MKNSKIESLRTPLYWFYKWEEEQPDQFFFRQPINGQYLDITWKEAGDEIRRMAAAINALDLKPGSNIALVSKNCAWWVMCDLAIMMSGHISIPVYPNVSASTLNYILDHAEAPLLFVGKLDDWDNMKSGVPSSVKMIGFPHYSEGVGQNWNDLTVKHEPVQGNPDRDINELATIIYTSGTTGNPKGVVHDFKNLAYAIENAKTVIDLEGDDARFFSYLPMAHIAERMLIEMGAIYLGNTIYFAESLDTFAKDLVTAQPTVFLGVPRIWTKFQMGILEKMSQKKLDLLLSLPIISGIIKKKIKGALGLGNARHYFTGAAPTPPALIKWYKKLGIELQEVYGMTENTAYSHFTRKGKQKIGSCGFPMPDVDVKINEVGEILVKCHCIMREYYKEPELTAKAVQDGYLHTGDEGVQDENGYLIITGRVKDIFKTEKGKYVAPSPIEMKIAKNQEVEQVCVVGSTLPQPIAMVVLSEHASGHDTSEVASRLEDVIKRLNPTLEKHERLKKVVVIKEPWTIENELLTPTMKMKRGPIEKKYAQRYQDWYADQHTVIWE
ncbi:MAG: AMP-binding protein [Bacteroidota bacterium]